MAITNLLAGYKADYFILRTPVLPVNVITDFNENVWSSDNDQDINLAMRVFFNAQWIQEAIYAASPSLHAELLKFLADQIKNPKDLSRLLNSLFRYMTRMAARCTPFGLFAGYSVGRITNYETKLIISSSYTKHVRLDMDFMARLSSQIIGRYHKRDFSYYANSSAYKVGKKMRYLETVYDGSNKKYQISNIDFNEVLLIVLNFVKVSRTYPEILKYLTSLGLPEQNASAYLNDLIDAQLLVNDLDANVTGPDYMKVLIEKLGATDILIGEQAKLSAVKIILDQTEKTKGVTLYKEIKALVTNMATDIDEGKLFQIDIAKPAISCELNIAVTEKIAGIASSLAGLGQWAPGSDKLSHFKKSFEKRYETASVRLTDALDPEIGLDYKIADSGSDRGNNSAVRKNIFNFKLNLYTKALKNGLSFVEISPADLVQFQQPLPLPDSICAMIRIHQEDLIEFKFANGPSAAKMIGRFTQFDAELEGICRDLLIQEEALHPESLFAEIAHIPQSRMGNVLARPHLRKYEIPYLSNSVLPEEQIVHIDDLYLKLVNGELILFSKSRGQRVIPRLTSAHAYFYNNLYLYHFLGDLQTQDVMPTIGWSWDALAAAEYLPRVVIDGVIVSPAQWNLTPAQFKDLSQEEFIEHWELARKRLNIADTVFLVEGDNELFLDLKNRRSLNIIRQQLKKSTSMLLKEAIGNFGLSPVKDVKGLPYQNEILIPFTRTISPVTKVTKHSLKHETSTERIFPLGSEFLYFKIYTGVTTADRILRDLLYPAFEKLEKRGLIEKYFFIRYADPEFHIRLRFKLINKLSAGAVTETITKVLNPLIKTGEINDLSQHKYVRELERYGRHNIKAAETCFFENSKSVLQLLSHFKKYKDISDDQKIGIAACFVDRMLAASGFDDIQKAVLYNSGRTSFAQEFQLSKNAGLKSQLLAAYKADYPYLNALLTGNAFSPNADQASKELDAIIKKYLKNLTPNLDLLKTSTLKHTEVSFTSLMHSLIHMFINRLFMTENRLQEMYVYEFLDKYYLSLLARRKKGQGLPASE